MFLIKMNRRSAFRHILIIKNFWYQILKPLERNTRRLFGELQLVCNFCQILWHIHNTSYRDLGLYLIFRVIHYLLEDCLTKESKEGQLLLCQYNNLITNTSNDKEPLNQFNHNNVKDLVDWNIKRSMASHYSNHIIWHNMKFLSHTKTHPE